MKKHVIIVAGGCGKRMKSNVPKQFIELQGKPMLMYSIEKFAKAIPEINIIVVLSFSDRAQWQILCKKHNFTTSFQLADGGETRFHSVKNGLAFVPENALVAIHDAARPLVDTQTITNAFEMAHQKGNACPAIPIQESIREVKNANNKAVDRNNYFIIQTPQCFQSSLIKKAFLQEYNPAFTDDASVLEVTGEKINLMDGNPENLKITNYLDLIIADVIIKAPQQH